MALAQIRPVDVPAFFSAAEQIVLDLANSPPTMDELQRVTEPLRQQISRASTGNNFWLYNLEGFGSSGRVRGGLSVYGTTKAAIAFLNKSLAEELKDKPVNVASIQPGMVITKMVTGQFNTQEELEKVKPIFNIIASRVEDVVPVLAEKVLANEKNGVVIQFLPRWKLMMRFFTAPFVKRNVFD